MDAMSANDHRFGRVRRSIAAADAHVDNKGQSVGVEALAPDKHMNPGRMRVEARDSSQFRRWTLSRPQPASTFVAHHPEIAQAAHKEGVTFIRALPNSGPVSVQCDRQYAQGSIARVSSRGCDP